METIEDILDRICKGRTDWRKESYYRTGFKAGILHSQRWIPVEEELPPKHVRIVECDYSEDTLIKSDDGGIHIGYYSYTDKKWKSSRMDNIIIHDVISWRPLEYKITNNIMKEFDINKEYAIGDKLVFDGSELTVASDINKEYAIGDKLVFDGSELTVASGINCNKCFFRSKCEEQRNFSPICSADQRNDRKDVLFVESKNVNNG